MCHFTLDPYLIIMRVMQGGIEYHFLTLFFDSTRDWTPVSRTIVYYVCYTNSAYTLVFLPKALFPTSFLKHQNNFNGSLKNNLKKEAMRTQFSFIGCRIKIDKRALKHARTHTHAHARTHLHTYTYIYKKNHKHINESSQSKRHVAE